MLTSAHREMLNAVFERILPSDDGAGAREADVLSYFDWFIARAESKAQHSRLEEGLDLLNSLALSTWRKPFVGCMPQEQDETLKHLESIPHRSARRFFQMLVYISLAGFLCHPRYGGNRSCVGWNYLGFEQRLPERQHG